MKIFLLTLRTIGVLAIIPITFFVWFYFWGPTPETVGTTFVGSLAEYEPEDTGLEDADLFLNMRMMKNKNENGEKLFEIAFSRYIGDGTATKFTKGVQFFGDMQFGLEANCSSTNSKALFIETSRNVFYNYTFSNAFYYDVTYREKEATSIASPTRLSELSAFCVTLGKGENLQKAQLKFRNDVTTSLNYIDKYFGVDPSPSSNVLTMLHNYKLVGDGYLYNALYNSVNSLDEGTYYITLDLSEFFEVWLWNESAQQYNKLTANEEFTYVTCKIEVENDGIATQNQSMFGMVAENDGSVQFEYDGAGNKYWKIENNVELTISDFVKRNSEMNNGTLIYLNPSVVTNLSKFKNLRITINLDLTQNDGIIGFDTFGLYGLKIREIQIRSDSQREFYFLSDSLRETEIKKIKHTDNVNLNFIDDVDCELEVLNG